MPSPRWRARPRSHPWSWGGQEDRGAARDAANRRTARRSNRRQSPPASPVGRDRSAGDSASGLLLDEALVSRFIHQAVELLRVLDAELEEPAIPHRVVVNHGRVGRQGLVELGDPARKRRVALACRLNPLADPRLLALRDPTTYFRQLDIDDVAELRLRVI